MNAIKIRRKPSWEIVLNALNEGIPVILDQVQYLLVEGKICIKLQVYIDKIKQADRILVNNISLNHFIDLCERLSEEELFSISCDTALTKLNRKNRKED